eukprot:TCONS_00050293-protein
MKNILLVNASIRASHTENYFNMWIQICFTLLLMYKTSSASPHKTSCWRQPGWCSHSGSTFTFLDCDGDGLLDPICSDHNGAFGVIGLTKGCRSKWPTGKCNNQKGRVCDRHKRWCSHSGATFFYQDCDNDGIPDPVCSDTRGSLGIIKSSQQCKSTWPHAVCKAKGAARHTCKRANGWCSHSGSVYTMMDCDRDGIPDPVCSDTNGNLGIIQSSKGCHSVWPKASCATMKGKVCARPKGWCSHAGSTFVFKDCDGDGIPDPVCSDTRGSHGVIKSSQGCKDGWPHDVCRK